MQSEEVGPQQITHILRDLGLRVGELRQCCEIVVDKSHNFPAVQEMLITFVHKSSCSLGPQNPL